MENEDVVGAAPTGDAPTISEWSTIALATKVCLILETTVVKATIDVALWASTINYNPRLYEDVITHPCPKRFHQSVSKRGQLEGTESHRVYESACISNYMPWYFVWCNYISMLQSSYDSQHQREWSEVCLIQGRWITMKQKQFQFLGILCKFRNNTSYDLINIPASLFT